MIKFIKNFRKDDSGAVTVDWVVLTAAVCALAGIAYTGVQSGISGMATATSTAMGSATISVDTGQ